MAKTIGYACNVKLQWLNHAVSMLEEELTEDEYRKQLHTYLSFEIDSPTRLRKTRDILMNIWYNADEAREPLREEARELLRQYPECDTAIHLCMLCESYPVFADVCKFMGHLFEFQDDVTNAVLRQKLYDEWGERGSLQPTTRRITLTLKDMGILSNESRTRYRLCKRTITPKPVVDFMLCMAMKIDGSGYYPFSSLNDFAMLFPFEYQVTKEQLMQNQNFGISNFGGEFSIFLNE